MKTIQPSSIIFKNLRDKEHSINNFCAYQYYNDFWNSVSFLEQSGFFHSKKIINEFCNKLKIGVKYNHSQFLQGVSEMMFWIYCSKQKYDFNIDVQLNKIKNTDVDIQIKHKNYIFNLEIKCPTLDNNKISNNTLKINTGFRTIPKEILQDQLTEINEEVFQKIIHNSDGEYTNLQYQKLHDTKILSYLSSCKDKFNLNEKNTINVLLIALPSNMLQSYWGYLYNPFSGIFTDKFPNTYYNQKENRYYNINDLEMTDVVILSNLVSGHLKPNDIFNSWNLKNYFNLLCRNIHSHKFKTDRNNEGFKILYELLPNDNLGFESQWEKLKLYQEQNNIPLDPIFLDTYLYNNYRFLC